MLLRLVFLLYAEERDMLPKGEIFQQYYSLVGLYKRLREDAALFPDTMDQRYGAWSQLLVLFRLIHDGGEAEEMRSAETARCTCSTPIGSRFLRDVRDVVSTSD